MCIFHGALKEGKLSESSAEGTSLSEGLGVCTSRSFLEKFFLRFPRSSFINLNAERCRVFNNICILFANFKDI